MRMWAVLLLLVSGPALSQGAIFECISKDGSVAWQSDPCPDGAKIGRIREFTPLTPQQVRQAHLDRQAREAQAARDQRERDTLAAQQAAQRQAWRAANPTAAQTQRQKCQSARDARDYARKNAPLWRPVDYLDSYDERVHKECNGIW